MESFDILQPFESDLMRAYMQPAAAAIEQLIEADLLCLYALLVENPSQRNPIARPALHAWPEEPTL